jgi:hypothetical protein
MKKTNILKNLVIPALALVILAGSTSFCKRERAYAQKYIPVEISESNDVRTLNIPVYSLNDVKPGNCAGYVRNASKQIFRKDYAKTAAWDRRYHDRVIVPFGELHKGDKLEELVDRGKLKPGMIIGVYNPGSTHNGELDETGNILKYTHNILYLGKDKDGKMKFANQFGKETLVVDSEWMNSKGIIPREVIDAKN